MTCAQLGGACDIQFHAETFEEIAEISKQHGKEMYEQGDAAHMTAMQHMKEKMQDPQAMQEWMAMKKNEFDSIPGYE